MIDGLGVESFRFGFQCGKTVRVVFMDAEYSTTTNVEGICQPHRSTTNGWHRAECFIVGGRPAMQQHHHQGFE